MARQGAKDNHKAREQEVTRDEKGHFTGSGNPKGRPKEFRDFKLRCQEFMDAEGWDELCDLARTRGRSQIHAIELLAAYGYGRPPQEVKVATLPAPPSVEETDKRLAGLLPNGSKGRNGKMAKDKASGVSP